MIKVNYRRELNSVCKQPKSNTANYPVEVDFKDLNKYLNIQITECGEENLYFTHEEKRYFCKCL
jgi:hypothetical protein